MSFAIYSWEAPLASWIKLNSDGSINNQQKASCGGLARDELGRFHGGFVVNLNICPITVAEI